MKDLKKIRAKVSELTAEIKRVNATRPPLDELEAELRQHLEIMARPMSALIENSVDSLTSGRFTYLTPETPAGKADFAIGLALAALGVDHIVGVAVAQAAQMEGAPERMPVGEKEAKLADLKRERYLLELEEQTVIGTEPQRADVSGAAYIGVPLDIAIECELV